MNRREWIIDVCKTCGRQAKWPFCEHRPTGYAPADEPSWCEPVAVREIRAPRRATTRTTTPPDDPEAVYRSTTIRGRPPER